jgi:hypothetical protein
VLSGALDHQQFTCANFRETSGKVIEASRCPSHVKHLGIHVAGIRMQQQANLLDVGQCE